MDDRLPVHLEVGALIRRVQAEGGFATVLRKGEPDAGTLMIVLTERGMGGRAYERMPQSDGSRAWNLSRAEAESDAPSFADYLVRRGQQDPDLWILELDIADGERFVARAASQH